MSGLLGNSSPATGGDASLVGQTVGLTPTYILRLRTTWTVNEIVVPQLVLSSITGAPVAGLTLVYETTVQLALGPLTLGCTFPASVDIVLGNGGVGCLAENVFATAGVPGEYKWQHVYTPSDITSCGADVSDNNFFKLPMTLSVAYGKHWDARGRSRQHCIITRHSRAWSLATTASTLKARARSRRPSTITRSSQRWI
jgi:hypothetical protein